MPTYGKQIARPSYASKELPNGKADSYADLQD